VYTEKKEYDKAIADFTEAIQINPNRAGAELYLGRAMAYSGKGDTAKAQADSAKATELMLRH
jgi:tetratricopeptide (TPR) repeat protein